MIIYITELQTYAAHFVVPFLNTFGEIKVT